MPRFPPNTGIPSASCACEKQDENPQRPPSPQRTGPPVRPPASLIEKNRRKRWLDTHPEYFDSADLELADPLLYDRMIRRFQTTKEREEEGRTKGFSGVFEANLMRAEAKMDALRNPDPNASFSYARGPDGEILMEDLDEVPESKEEGTSRWRWEMEMRFLRGADDDFDYESVDKDENLDEYNWNDREEKYYDEEEPEWDVETDEHGNQRRVELKGETGIQDF